jgi:hypothetical protein
MKARSCALATVLLATTLVPARRADAGKIEIVSKKDPNPILWIEWSSMHLPGKPTELSPPDAWDVQILDEDQQDAQYDLWDKDRSKVWNRYGAFCTNLAAAWLERLKGPSPDPMAPFAFHTGMGDGERTEIVKLNLQWELGCGSVTIKQKEWLTGRFGGTAFAPSDVVDWVERTTEGKGTRVFLGSNTHALALYVLDETYAVFYDPDVGVPRRIKRRKLRARMGQNDGYDLNYARVPAGETDKLIAWLTRRDQ